MVDYYITIGIFLCCLYGFVLFSWWWVKLGDASSIFKCMTFMYLGFSIDRIYSILTYKFFIKNMPDIFITEPLFSTTLWRLRSLLLFITLFIIQFILTRRIIVTRKGSIQYHRRAND